MMFVGFILMILSCGYMLNDWMSMNEKITKEVKIAFLIYLLGLVLVFGGLLIV